MILRVEQAEPTQTHPRNQVNQRDLAGVGNVREHAFAEESAPQANPI